MITDDEAYEALAMLEEIKRGLHCSIQVVKEHFDPKMHAYDESTERGFARIFDEEAWASRLSELKLPPDQELLAYELMTLPKEAIELLQERYKELLGGQK
jgi:hypothetical protein